MDLSRLSGNRDERVCAVMALIDAVVAVAPVPFVTIVAFPVACVCVCFADLAEDANFHPVLGVVFAH